MSVEDFIIEYKGECFLCMFDNGSEMNWLLGDSFLRGYYTVHSYQNATFGLVPHNTSTKSILKPGVKPV